jgi:hypothetical protein
MRPLTEDETRVFFSKLAKYMDKNIRFLIDRPAGIDNCHDAMLRACVPALRALCLLAALRESKLGAFFSVAHRIHAHTSPPLLYI